MPDSRRERLRTELIRLRLRSGIGGRPMGVAIGASQGTVWRIEHGETLPSMRHVRGWLDKVGPEIADEATRQRLLDLAEAVHAETRGWSELLGDEGHAQDEARRRESAATRVRNFQPTLVPGLLQTPEYARAYFEVGRTVDVEAATLNRVARQRVLQEPGRQFQFLLAERVLSVPVGGPEVLAAQRDRLVSLARLPTVELGVLPDAQTVALPWHNFTMWDTADGVYVLAELVDGEHEVTDLESIAVYELLWERLWGASVHGDDAVKLVRDLE